MEASLELRVLGPVVAVGDAGHVGFDGAKPRTAVATLALAPGRTVPDSRLRAMLWGATPPATASAQLYTYVSRLRRRLGAGVDIVRRPPGYALVLGTARLDLLEFERLLARGQDRLAAGDHEEAAEHLAAALSLWRGDALSDVTPYLADAERPRLEDLRLTALEARAEADLALGRHRGLVPELTALVTAHPLRERLRAQLMTALYRDNRQAEALALYDSGRKVLADELGLAPGAVLEQVFGAILRGADPAPARHRVSTAAARPALLPTDTADFTGRAAELARLVGADGHVVVTGMAGVGKTALAVHAAHAVDAPGGRLYADLGAAAGRPRDPAEVLAGFLRALGVREVPAHLDERAQLYRDRLADRRAVVVPDDAACGAQVAPLLPGTPACRVIVTARRLPAVLTGARTLTLTTPPPEESLALLAAIVGADRVAAEPGAARELTELCGHLPLAVRVLATRIAARPGRPMAHLVERLRRAGSVLDELALADTAVRDRLRTGVADLPAPQGSALHRLSHLDTPEFPVWAAAQVLATSPAAAEALLDDLVEARVLEATTPDPNGQPRFRMHPLLRQLARDRPPEAGYPRGANALLTGGSP